MADDVCFSPWRPGFYGMVSRARRRRRYALKRYGVWALYDRDDGLMFDGASIADAVLWVAEGRLP